MMKIGEAMKTSQDNTQPEQSSTATDSQPEEGDKKDN
jgi:hypothetical protein